MEDNYNIVNCPHCELPIQLYFKELNCKIFRHGIYKNTLKQIDPHLNKKQCEKLVENKLIYGCGKPFRINIINNKMMIEKCEYI